MLPDPPQDLPLWTYPQERPLLFIVDRADQFVPELEAFQRQWAHRPGYRLVLATRSHERRLEAGLAGVQVDVETRLADLSRPEHQQELEGFLERNGKLEALDGYSRQEQARLFRELLTSPTVPQGQLLAALLVLRQHPGERRGFVDLVQRRWQDFLRRGEARNLPLFRLLALYVLTAPVHRWDRYLHREVLLQALTHLTRDPSSAHRLLDQTLALLEEEFLTGLTREGDLGQRWRTRHPVLAWTSLVLLYPQDFQPGLESACPASWPAICGSGACSPGASCVEAHQALLRALQALGPEQARRWAGGCTVCSPPWRCA